jgi:hypothetical protein
MNWTGLLQDEMDSAYNATLKLIDRLSEEDLSWKPSEGENWMTVGQLLYHIGTSLGGGFKGFVTGDWGFPEGVDPSKAPPKDMLPPAERLPSVKSLQEARNMLDQDKATAREFLGKCIENELSEKIVTAPWDPREKVLGYQLLTSIEHLKSHKSQLYYYLKMKGESVGTPQLWGMG